MVHKFLTKGTIEEKIDAIKVIGPAKWATIKKQCNGRLKSLQELNEVLFSEGTGLFPLPKEISFYALVRRLRQQGKIKNNTHGIYVKAQGR